MSRPAIQIPLPPLAVRLETMTAGDWPAVARIFQEGIETGQATFEIEVPTWERWDAAHLKNPRIVAKHEGRVAGWAALSPASHREVYAGVAETSVYVAAEARRRGVGRALMKGLVTASEAAGFWTLQSVFFPENQGTRKLLQEFGFRQVGVRQRLGKLHGRWRDVLLWERRSNRVGI